MLMCHPSELQTWRVLNHAMQAATQLHQRNPQRVGFNLNSIRFYHFAFEQTIGLHPTSLMGAACIQLHPGPLHW